MGEKSCSALPWHYFDEIDVAHKRASSGGEGMSEAYTITVLEARVVEAARKLRNSLLNEETDLWEDSILQQMDQTQTHRLNEMDIALDALEEKLREGKER